VIPWSVLASDSFNRCMGDPKRVRPDELEILVARELRKAGVTLSRLAVLTRNALSSKDPGEYSVDLGAAIGDGDAVREALIECRNEAAPTGATAVQALDVRRRARPARDGPVRLLAPPTAPSTAEAPPTEPRLAIMFSMSGYEPQAVRDAGSLGIILLAIADGPAAFRRSQWAVGAQPPAWVPEYMAELVDLDPAGAVRYRMLVSGTSTLALPR
jgi:hypothetical protein